MSVWEVIGDLDRSQPRVGEQLVCALRDAIEQGRLPSGSKLPSTRDLAIDLGVSRGLVVGAYERLTAEGRLSAKRGAGTIVTGQANPDPQQVMPRPPTLTALPRFSAESVGTSLRPGVPDLAMFPRTAWRRAYERILTSAADVDFDGGDPAGAFRLRAELSAYLWRIRTSRVDVDHLLITTGRTQAFALLARTLRAAGVEAIGVETPGNPAVAECCSWNGVIPVPIPVDEAGIDVAVLAKSRLPAVVVTPAHQYPTGVVLAPDRRRALVEWARDTGGLIVEDDYDAELRYDREPFGCVQGLAPECVVLVGSVSGTLAPALRLGWLVAPQTWCGHLRQARSQSDGWGSTLEQLAFAELLAGSAYDRHIRRVRRTLRERREGLVTAVRRYLPYAKIMGVAAGLHILIELPDTVDDETVVARARTVGLDPLSLTSLWVEGPGYADVRRPQGLVLGYAAQSPHELARAARLLARCVG